jgi:hypothetical protein
MDRAAVNEPRKLAIVFLVIMAIGLVALAVEWLRLRINGWIALLIVSLVLLALALAIHPVRAQEQHGHTHDGAVGKFYQTWMMPDNRAISCCHKEDCSPAESKFENGHWMARKVGTKGEFSPVPEHKIERERDSPDGRSHLCGKSYSGFASGFQVYCFAPGNGA